MKKQVFTLISICIFTLSNAQNCIESNLSKVLDFDILLISKDQNILGKAEVNVGIYNKKKTIKVQTIKLESEFILKSESFKECRNNRSYTNDKYLESNENDFGDLIVADFNFDGKEDVAVKRNEGGNGGPLYNFYIQTRDEHFILDTYLSNEMIYFPDYIDSRAKTLHTYVRINTATEEGTTYLYDSSSKTWSIAKKLEYRN